MSDTTEYLERIAEYSSAGRNLADKFCGFCIDSKNSEGVDFSKEIMMLFNSIGNFVYLIKTEQNQPKLF